MFFLVAKLLLDGKIDKMVGRVFDVLVISLIMLRFNYLYKSIKSINLSRLLITNL